MFHRWGRGPYADKPYMDMVTALLKGAEPFE